MSAHAAQRIQARRPAPLARHEVHVEQHDLEWPGVERRFEMLGRLEHLHSLHMRRKRDARGSPYVRIVFDHEHRTAVTHGRKRTAACAAARAGFKSVRFRTRRLVTAAHGMAK